MALLLNAAKQGRMAAARVLVAQTGRGLSMAAAGTAKASGFPCAGARERALVTLDLVPKALKFGSRDSRPVATQGVSALAPAKASAFPCAGARERALVPKALQLGSRPVAPPAPAKASAFPYAGAAGGSSMVTLDLVPKALRFAPTSMAGAGAPAPVVVAKKAGSGSVEGMADKAAPSLVKKKAAAITAVVRSYSYVTRGGRCWSCRATPEAWEDQEKAIAAHIRKVEKALGEQISMCLAGNKTLIKQTRNTHRRVAFSLAGAIAFAVASVVLGVDYSLQLVKRRLLDILDCPELFAILRRHQGEAQNQLLEFSQEPGSRELRRAVAMEVWDAAVKDIFTARSFRQMIGSLFWSNKDADKKKNPVAVVPDGAAGDNKDADKKKNPVAVVPAGAAGGNKD